VYFWFGASFLCGAGQSAGDGRNATGQMDMVLARPRQIAPNVKGTHQGSTGEKGGWYEDEANGTVRRRYGYGGRSRVCVCAARSGGAGRVADSGPFPGMSSCTSN